MKCLSLRQPFAELVCSGRKTIELRNWNTKFRGRFLVHASKGPIMGGAPVHNLGNDLPRGFIIGAATLIDVKQYKSAAALRADRDKHLYLGPYHPKIYGFVVRNARRMKPIPMKGQLNFFEVKVGER